MKFSYQLDATLVSPLRHRQLMAWINAEIGREHKYVTLPKHFEEGAENVYHYQRRRARYLKKKQELYHHQRPLVYSGLLFAYLMQKSKLTKTYAGWRIYCKAPFPMREQMRSEIERINKSEVTAYKKKMGQLYVKLLPKYARKRRMKGSG